MTRWRERAATVAMTLGLMAGISGTALVLAWGCFVVVRWLEFLP